MKPYLTVDMHANHRDKNQLSAHNDWESLWLGRAQTDIQRPDGHSTAEIGSESVLQYLFLTKYGPLERKRWPTSSTAGCT